MENVFGLCVGMEFDENKWQRIRGLLFVLFFSSVVSGILIVVIKCKKKKRRGSMKVMNPSVFFNHAYQTSLLAPVSPTSNRRERATCSAFMSLYEL